MAVDKLSDDFAKMAVAHGYKKHHIEENTFNDPALGKPMNITSPQDLRDALADILKNGDNEIVMKDDRTALYNKEHNVYAVLDQRNPMKSTVFRPNNGVGKIRAFKEEILDGNKNLKRLAETNLERKAVHRYIRKQMMIYHSLDSLPITADALFDSVAQKFNNQTVFDVAARAEALRERGFAAKTSLSPF